MLHDVMAADKV